MIHLFVNALAASAGGGLTYIRNVVPHLESRRDVRTTLLVNSEMRHEFASLTKTEVIDVPVGAGTAARFLFEQRALKDVVRSIGADVLLSTGNFALQNSPVPQILLSRNALYTCADFYRDLRQRHEYRMWFDTRLKARLARKSIQTAEVTVAPSEAFARELREWTGKKVVAIHHGFDAEAFESDSEPLRADLSEKINSTEPGFRLLFVSHYNYYRNFETLIRAIARVVNRPEGKRLRLFLTCKLRSEDNPGSYGAERAAKLVNDLGLRSSIVELGTVPYSQLHHIYRACDFYVTPAYCESFAHPLVEAMSSGLPIIASDIPVHREICRESSVYFPRFSDEDLSREILRLAASPERRREFGSAARRRSADFSWSRHLDQIAALGMQLISELR
jgi:glycosyltransferase involved in cell wall biosynthesis